MNPQSKTVTLRTWAGFQANQGKCLGRVVVVMSVVHPLNHADSLSSGCFQSRVVAISQFTFPDVGVKGSSTECPLRRGLQMRIALLLQKENNEPHHVKGIIFIKCFGSFGCSSNAPKDDYLRVFTERAEGSSSGCVSVKWSRHPHSFHYSLPAPPNTTHTATVNYRGAGEVCKLTRERSGESPGGGDRKREREGLNAGAAW